MNSQQVPQSVKDLHQSSNVNHMMNKKMRTQQNKINQKRQRNNILISLMALLAVIIALIVIIISLLKQNAEYKKQNTNYDNLMKKIASSDANVNKSKIIEQFLSQKPIVYSNNGEIQQFINLQISECQQKLSLFINQSQKTLKQQKKQIQEKSNKKIAQIKSVSNKVLFSAKQIINQYKSEYEKKHKILQTERSQKEGSGLCRTLIQTIGKDHSRKFNQIVWGRPFIKEPIPQNQPKLYFPTKDELVNMTSKDDLIIVTVVRQESFLQHLYKYMSKYSSQINSWHLWVTSQTLPHTIQFIQNLSDQNDWIKIIRLDQSQQGIHQIKYLHQIDNQTNKIYLKIDQKVIWIQKNFIQIIFKYRFRLTNHLFVIPNIVNNGIINHIQQNFGAIKHKTMFDYQSLGNSMWDETLVSYIHNKLIDLIETNRTQEWKAFKEWQLLFYERINMTVCLYYSNTYSSLEFMQEKDYDTLYSQIYPRKYGAPGTIISEPIFSYQANQYQTEFLQLQFPLIFQKYKKFADSL